MNKLSIGKFVLPLAVVAVVAMILFPMPHILVDVMLAGNFSFCIILLLSSLYVSEPDRFTTLPTILLLTTLIRLGLNISSTRLILSGGDVPDMIISFGQFVVSGSTVVGLVIFSIISIIQFIVIAKGSERVAEVAARFTLDALPGKQMSIDADMRAGILSLSEAREKRRELHRESKLYGALDGAMKFVKGDAIVGLCIICINIVAGFLIGIVRDHMPIQQALEKYTLLTIGDGLVSQIPAVLVSIAAGIIVTRVSEKEGGNLSEEISRQLTGEPLSMLIGGVVLLAFSLLPGLPFIPILLSALAVLYVWNNKHKADNLMRETPVEYIFKPKILPALTLRLSALGASKLQEENRVVNYYDALRSLLYDDMGIIIPDLCFDVDPIEQEQTAEFLINGVSIKKVKFINSNTMAGCIDPWSRCIGTTLRELIYNNLLQFINESHTRTLLDVYENKNPELIRNLVPDKISYTYLTILTKNLISEGLSIRDFNKILEGISEYFEKSSATLDVYKNFNSKHIELLNVSRKQVIGQFIKSKITYHKILSAYGLPIDLEKSLSMQIEADLPLHPSMIDQIKLIGSVCLEARNESFPILLIVPPKLRLMIYETLEPNNNEMLVLSYDELPSDYKYNLIREVLVEYEEAA